MHNPTYLARTKSGIFYLRWPLPKQLHPLNKTTFLKFSLSTREPKTALMMARVLVHIGDQINRQGIALTMRYDEVRGLLTRHFRELLEKEKGRINAEGRLTPAQHIDYQKKLEDTQGAIGEGGIWLGETNDGKLVNAFMAKYGLDFAVGSEPYGWLQRDLKFAYQSFIKSVLAYDRSLDDFDLHIATPAAPASERTRQHAALTLGEIVDRYLKEREAGNVWADRTKIEKRDHADLLFQVIPRETDVSAIDAQGAAKVKQTLMTLPKNWRKLPQTRDLTISEAIAINGLERLKPPSINKYLQTYADLFGWAAGNGFIDRNVFAGLQLKYDKDRTALERKPFSDEQIATIITYTFDNAIINSRKAYQKWFPILGAYTGARLNEIAQLEVDDLQEENGILYLDISDTGDNKALKNKASRRKIPLHSKLQESSFPLYVKQLKGEGHKHVFHELSYSPEHGRGRSAGRWFNEKLLPALGINNPEFVFHSFRHTVNSKLVRANIPDPHIKAIMGHTQVGMTYKNYLTEGFDLKQLSEALEALTYGS